MPVQFVDEVRIQITSGAGGDGCLAFLREANRPKGGPSGGDGGNGGDVVFYADPALSTLLDFRFKQHHKARNGEPGRGKNQHGATADDLVIPVPVGTVVKDAETGEVLHDLDTPDEEWVCLPGGRGGRGNARFATSVNRAPRKKENGTPGQTRWVRLELKLLADVGLIGFPNSGKSTLISKISAARPKVADYPFTTVKPVLGVVQWHDDSFVVADIPGLIEGAHEGQGLGHRFLRHAERTSLFLHVVDLADDIETQPLERFDIIAGELVAYDPTLGEKPVIVVLNKLDVTEARERFDEVAAALRERGHVVHGISAVTGEGVVELVEVMGSRLKGSS